MWGRKRVSADSGLVGGMFASRHGRKLKAVAPPIQHWGSKAVSCSRMRAETHAEPSREGDAMTDYPLQIILRDRVIMRFQGSDLANTRRDAIDLVATYLEGHPEDRHALDQPFKVVDDVGRLLLVIPPDIAVSEARVSNSRLGKSSNLDPRSDPSSPIRSEPDFFGSPRPQLPHTAIEFGHHTGIG